MSKEDALSPAIQITETSRKVSQPGMFQINLKTNTVDWNSTLKKLHEVSMDHVPNITNCYGKCKAVDSKNKILQLHKQAIENGTPFELDYEIITAKGNSRPLHLSAQPVIIDGECTSVYGVVEDRSENDHTHSKNLQIKHQLNYAEKLAKSGSWNLNVVTGELTWSDNFYAIFNHNKNNPISYEIYIGYVHKDDKQAVRAKFDLALKTKQFPELNYRIQLKDGTVKTLCSTGKVICNEQGEVISMLGTCQDISEKIAIKEKISQTSHQLKLTENINEAGSWQLDLKKEEFRWTDNLYRIFEIEIGTKMTFETLQNYTHPDDLEHLKEKFNEILLNKKSHKFLHRIILENGSVKTVQVVSDAVTDTSGQVIQLIGTTQDISHKVNKDLELIQTHHQLSLTEETSKAGTWSWNPSSGKFKWSENLYEIMDFNKNTLINFALLYTRIHPEDKDIVKKSMQFVQDTNTKCKFVHRIIIKDGSVRTLEIVADIISNDINKERELIGTTRDITNTIDIEHELVQKDQLLDFAEHLTTMGYWRYKPSENSVFWSKNLFQIFEQPIIDNLTFETYFNKVHPKDKAFVKKKVAQSINDNKFYNFTHRILLKNGTTKVIQIIGKVTVNKTDGTQELLGTCLDITEGNTKDLELSEKNYRLNVAEKMAMIGYWQWNTPTNEVIWSNNLHSIYGHKKDAPLTFETYINYIHEEDREQIVSKLTSAMKGGEFPNSTYRIQLNDGTIKIIKSLGKIIRDSEGQVLEMTGVCQDITETKTKELELLQKNQQLNMAEQMAMLGSWEWKPKKNIYKWSDNLYRIYGFELGSEINIERALASVYPPDLEDVKTLIKEIFEGKEHKHSYYRILLHTGEIKTLEVRREITKDNEGNIEIIGSTQDITDQIKAKQLIQEKNHLLSVSEEMATMGSWKWNPTTGVSTWSDNLYKIYGIELNTPMTFEKFLSKVHPEDIDRTYQHINNILETHESGKILSFRIIKNDNTVRSLELVSEIIENQNGDIAELIGTTRDVTEKIEAKEKIKEKNQLLSYAEEIAKMGSWHFDLRTNELKWSDNLYKIYNLEVSSPMDMNIFYSKIHPDDLEYVKDRVKRYTEGDESTKPILFRIVLHNGNVLSIESIAGITKNHSGEVVVIAGTAQDITERLKIEKDLLEKNQLLNFAEQLSSIGHWKWDIVKDVMNKSENLLKILDFEQGTKPDFSTYLQKVHPADREKVIEMSQKIIETKKFNTFHHRIIKNDNSIRTIKIIGEVILDIDDNVIELIGSSQDITEQIEAQQKILDTNRSLEKSTIILTSKNKQLAEFNHITSHNLRSPVSNLNALLALYKKTKNEQTKQEVFEKFEIVIEHLSETLNALIETITIKHNAAAVTEEISFEQMLLKTKNVLAAEMIETGAKITSDFTNAENVKYNSIYLESIFLNLVSNSLKYRSLERVPEIFISSKKVNGRVLLEFKDNGSGIDMNMHGSKIFGLNKVFHKHPEAKGVGLFLTKAQITSMGGSISVDSKVNIGTTFYITLN
ncbi:PAS domain-containing protein [Maribacter sp. M208]|uniref:PAS domain-containing protein n=1 Tax=Maribacter huludaoensis TaxID=3030010 RepID=UPI0023EAB5E8|nr:PAS domain-containing protein [Maribacter huludaoensis]MDF4221356.1 PAS domain-containing protein [Maribacter huludaoensis]